MPHLICGAYGCVYNNDSLCNAPMIHVQGGTTNSARHTYCNTFTDNISQFVVAAVEDMAVPPKESINAVFTAPGQVDTEFSSMDSLTEIGCTAVKCIHNNDYKCTARNVKINAPGGNKTLCESFTKK